MRRAFQYVMLVVALWLPVTADAMIQRNRQMAPGGFSAEVEVTQTATYDSNPLRSATNAEEIFGSVTAPELTVHYKTPRSSIESTTRVEENIFDRSKYNSTDLHQKIGAMTRNARWVASIDAAVDYDTTRTSELTNYALNLPKVRRTKAGISPKIAFKPDPHNSFGISSSAAHVSYDNAAYSDYNLYAIAPSYEHRFDAMHSATLVFNARRYETTAQSQLTTDSYGPQVGWVMNLTPHFTARVSAGAEHTKKRGSNAGSDTSNWNHVFTGQLTYQDKVDLLDFSATRAREPFGNGTDTLLTTLKAKGRHHFNPSLSGNAEVMYRKADYSTEPGVNLDRGISTGVGMTYTLSQDWELNADYRLRSEKLTGVSGTVDQHIAMLGVTYHPTWSKL